VFLSCDRDAFCSATWEDSTTPISKNNVYSIFFEIFNKNKMNKAKFRHMAKPVTGFFS